MKYFYQAEELDLITQKPDGGGMLFDGYVEAEDPKTALNLARQKVTEANLLEIKNHEPVEEAPDIPPPRFVLMLLKDEKNKILFKK